VLSVGGKDAVEAVYIRAGSRQRVHLDPGVAPFNCVFSNGKQGVQPATSATAEIVGRSGWPSTECAARTQSALGLRARSA